MTTTYAKALEAFLAHAQSLQNPKDVIPTTFEVESGRVYDRVVGVYGSSRSAFCFVRKSDGAVLKAASWKAPAKHVRGSIFATSPHGYGIGQFGANYLR